MTPDPANIEPGDVVCVDNSKYGELRTVREALNASNTALVTNLAGAAIGIHRVVTHYIPWQRHEAAVEKLEAENKELRKELTETKKQLVKAGSIEWIAIKEQADD